MKVKKDELKIKAQRAFAIPNMTFDISISTHSGLVREVNEDSFSLNGYRRRREKSALTYREQMTGRGFYAGSLRRHGRRGLRRPCG